VQWRIFDAGRIRSNIRVQNARQEQALATYEKTVLTSFEDVENALVAYAKDQTRRVSLEQAVTSSQRSLEISHQLYTNGLTSFINVLDAERSLYQSQDDLVQSDQAVTEDLIALYKAMGGGWDEPAPSSASSPAFAAAAEVR
jgi:outer membrane protein TolC